MSAQVDVRQVSKQYKRYPSHWARLAEWLTFGLHCMHEDRLALKGVSFQVQKGDSVGIIGQNGAGKSTLLKILTGTAQPTRGRIEIHGRVSALLELGLGFHPSFSGRANAMMTCQMMGLSAEESRRCMPQIAEFSELGDYMEQPMRVYSTGMQVRLAFSAATAVRPEILIVDEALSVGDTYFQHKCIKRIRAFKARGTTLLFVSHDPGAVKSLCERALLLDGGRLLKDGTPDEVLDYYNGLVARRNADEQIRQVESGFGGTSTRSGSGAARIREVEMLADSGHPARAFRVGEHARICCSVAFSTAIQNPTVGFMIRDRMGNDVFGTNTFHLKTGDLHAAPGDLLHVTFRLGLNLGRGTYSLSLAVHSGYTHLEGNCDWWDQCLVFQIIPGKFAFDGIAALPVEARLQVEKKK